MVFLKEAESTSQHFRRLRSMKTVSYMTHVTQSVIITKNKAKQIVYSLGCLLRQLGQLNRPTAFMQRGKTP